MPWVKSVRSVRLRSLSETCQRARVPGAQDQRRCHSASSSCAFCEQEGHLAVPPLLSDFTPCLFRDGGHCARSTRAFCPSTGSGSQAESREGRALREHGDHPSGPACSYSPAPLSPFHRRVDRSILDCAHFLTHSTLSASRRAHVPGEHISIMLPPSSLVTSLVMGAD